LDIDKVDRRETRPRVVIDVFSPLPDELRQVCDYSNTVSVIAELSLKPPLNIIRIRFCLKEKPDDHSLLGLNPTGKI
jgi:hypothetical protein